MVEDKQNSICINVPEDGVEPEEELDVAESSTKRD